MSAICVITADLRHPHLTQGPLPPPPSARRQEAAAGGGGGGGGEYVRPYRIISSLEIHDLYSLHPHICTLTSSQELYGLPTSDKDRSHDHVDGCNGAREGGLGSGQKQYCFCEVEVQELDINDRG